MRRTFKVDAVSFSAEAYTVAGYPGVAFRTLGWETVNAGQLTGAVVVQMVGFDHHYIVHPSDLTPTSLEHCPECGRFSCRRGRTIEFAFTPTT